MTDLTYQQTTILARVERNNKDIAAANIAVRGRASFIATASTTIVGVIAAARFFPASPQGSAAEFALLGAICLCSLGIYWNVVKTWQAGNVSFAGSTNIDVLYKSYISADLDVAYDNLLSDQCKALSENLEENATKYGQLQRAVWFFMLQLALLAVAVAWASFAPLAASA